MMRYLVSVLALVLLPAIGAGSFEKGGVLDEGPRAAAIGGAGASLSDDALTARSCMAGLAWLGSPSLAAAYGVDGAKNLSSLVMGAAANYEGAGLGLQYRRTALDLASEQLVSLGTGIPVEELGWLSLGFGLKMMAVDMKIDQASGFGLDLGLMGRHSLPWGGIELRWAAAVEDAMGGLKWKSGLEEDLARQSRLGLGVKLESKTAFLAELRRINSVLGDETIVAGGIEQVLTWWGADIALRAGVREGTVRSASVSGGLGLKYGPVSFDYGAVQALETGGGMEHFLSFSWIMGAVSPVPMVARKEGRVKEESDIQPVTNTLELSSRYESAEFTIKTPRNADSSTWVVVIMDSCGEVVWDLEGEGDPPASLKWNGTTLQGGQAPAGAYSCVVMLRGPSSLHQISRKVQFNLKRSGEEVDSGVLEGPGGF